MSEAPSFFNDLKTLRFSTVTGFLKDFSAIFKSSPSDVKAAYMGVFAGILLLLLQAMVSFLL